MVKIKVSRTLEKISLFSRYMTRTRKREIDEERPERRAEITHPENESLSGL